jgi:hypothetical protein
MIEADVEWRKRDGGGMMFTLRKPIEQPTPETITSSKRA